MATIYLNGESREISDGLTLARLLESLKLSPDEVAVERNRRIVPRGEWEQTLITAGDRLEVVHFVGGGSSADLRFSGPRLFVCGPRDKPQTRESGGLRYPYNLRQPRC